MRPTRLHSGWSARGRVLERHGRRVRGAVADDAVRRGTKEDHQGAAAAIGAATSAAVVAVRSEVGVKGDVEGRVRGDADGGVKATACVDALDVQPSVRLRAVVLLSSISERALVHVLEIGSPDATCDLCNGVSNDLRSLGATSPLAKTKPRMKPPMGGFLLD
jgi:hypothetical protein